MMVKMPIHVPGHKLLEALLVYIVFSEDYCPYVVHSIIFPGSFILEKFAIVKP